MLFLILSVCIKLFSASANYVFFFRNVFQRVQEMGLHSVAISVINSVKRNYPPDEGAHIALRKYFFPRNTFLVKKT